MSKIVFATVGTSAVENCVRDWTPNKIATETWTGYFSKLLDDTAQLENVRNRLLLEDYPSDESIVHNMLSKLTHFEQSFGGPSMVGAGRLVSAEVASLFVMSKQKSIAGFDEDDEIWLMPSDTSIGQICADANKIVLGELFPKPRIECTQPIKGVRFAVREEHGDEILSTFLKDGLASFEDEIKTKTAGRNAHSVLDITGGFKGLVFFAPLLCTRNLIDVVYYYYQEAAVPARFLKGEVITRLQNPDVAMSYSEEAIHEALE